MALLTGSNASADVSVYGPQVPKHVTEMDLRPLFEPYGEIMCLNVLRTQRGQGPSAGCGFVEVPACIAEL